MTEGIRLWDVKWEVTTAGPSPDHNRRSEVFFLGCNKATVDNNPCLGCFNTKLWDATKAEFTHNPMDMVANITRFAPNKYVTIGGGEPTDQFEHLITLAGGLQANGFHVMVYTWKSLIDVWNGKFGDEQKAYFKRLIEVTDMIADGEFLIKERLYKGELADGMLSSVGSGNQVLWDTNAWRPGRPLEGYALRDLDALHIKLDNSLVYLVKDPEKEAEKLIVEA